MFKLSVPMFTHPKSSTADLIYENVVYIISLILPLFLPLSSKNPTNSPSHFQKFIPLSVQSNNSIHNKFSKEADRLFKEMFGDREE